jgi:YD repeat-containing protein
VPTAYLWSYGAALPIIEFKNATYAQVQTAISSAGLNGNTIRDGTFTAEQIKGFASSIKPYLPNARVTIYTHQPLVGITSVTDHNGKTTGYEYDALGRLVLIRDNNNKILSKYEYQIKK